MIHKTSASPVLSNGIRHRTSSVPFACSHSNGSNRIDRLDHPGGRASNDASCNSAEASGIRGDEHSIPTMLSTEHSKKLPNASLANTKRFCSDKTYVGFAEFPRRRAICFLAIDRLLSSIVLIYKRQNSILANTPDKSEPETLASYPNPKRKRGAKNSTFQTPRWACPNGRKSSQLDAKTETIYRLSCPSCPSPIARGRTSGPSQEITVLAKNRWLRRVKLLWGQ